MVSLFTYDALNRLKSVSYPATPSLSVQMSYDMTHDGNRGVGRLTAIQDSGGLIGYQYDPRGNLTEQIRSVPVQARTINEAVGYGYDGSNQTTRIDYPAGFSVHYRRNAGRVTGVDLSVGSGAPVPLATDIQYLPFGPVKSLLWGNGLQLSRTYDQDYRLTFQQIGEAFTTYGYDANGNLSYIGKGYSESSEYQYDPLDRLIEEADRDVRKAYSYDGNGNRLSRTTTFSNELPRDDEVQALEIASNSNRVSKLNDVTVDRDAAGNTLRQRDGISYTYDAQGRLKQVFDGSELIADYRYNSLGQRTVKQAYVGGSVVASWTYLYGHAGDLLGYSQYGADGKKVSSQYIVWLDRMPLAALDIAYASDGVSISSLKKLYLHSDHLNTPRLATNDTQEPQWRWDSDAFGVGLPNQDVDGDGVAVDIGLRFPGQLYDEHSQLYYNYFRDYDPQTGRYVESDPIGLNGGLNTYGYVMANPMNTIDPKGLMGYPNGPTVPPGQQVARYGFTACLGMYCASYIQGDPAPTGTIGVGGLGAAILVCEMPPPPETSCGPDWKDNIPDGGVVSGVPGRAGLFVGGQLNPDGTFCGYGGLMGGIPGPNYSTGPIEY